MFDRKYSDDSVGGDSLHQYVCQSPFSVWLFLAQIPFKFKTFVWLAVLAKVANPPLPLPHSGVPAPCTIMRHNLPFFHHPTLSILDVTHF